MRKKHGVPQQARPRTSLAAQPHKAPAGKGLKGSSCALLVFALTLLISLLCEPVQAQTACSTGGQIVYASGTQTMSWCNGSTLVAVGGANNGTCTAADAGVFRLNTGMVEWCNGTNWKRPTPSSTSLGACSTAGLLAFVGNNIAVCDGTKYVSWADSPTSGIYAAYSVRRILGYSGSSALRVRRSSDNTELDIGFVGDDLDTASLLTFVGTGTGTVVKLYDQSGNGRTMNAIGSPAIVNSGSLVTINGRPAMTGGAMQAAGVNFTGTAMSAVGFSYGGAVTNSRLMSLNKTGGLDYSSADGAAALYAAGANLIKTYRNGVDIGVANDGNPSSSAVVFDGTNVTFYANGVAGSTSASSGSFAANELWLMGRSPNGTEPWSSTAYAAEFLFYDKALSAAEVSAWATDQRSYFRATTPGLSIAQTSPAGTIVRPASGSTTVTYTVTRSGLLTGTTTVNWATANGTATAGTDYVAGSGTLSFAAGETTKTFTVSVLSLGAGSKAFTVNLAAPSNAYLNTSSITTNVTNSLYAANFTGTSYFTFSSNPLPAPGSGNWTVEFWINRSGMTDSSNERVMLDSTDKFAIDFYTTNAFAVWGGSTYYVSSTIASTGWNHVAIVRNGTTTTTFINGVAAGSATMSFASPSTVMYLGGPTYLKAQLANFHISGVARYSSSFTPTKNNAPDANSLVFVSFNNTTANTAPGSSITLTPTGATSFVQNFN